MARTVTPVTRDGVSPSACAVAAANSSVQRPVGWPKSRGERWSRSRKRAAAAASKGGVQGVGPSGARSQGRYARPLEGMDGVAQGLVGAAEGGVR